MSKAKSGDKYGIYIGVKPETVKEVRASINDILASGADQSTIKTALKVLAGAAKIGDISITNCNISTESFD